MKCSFIVSSFDRPQCLRCLLASLAIQNEPDFEVIVTDNSSDTQNTQVVTEINDRRFHYVKAEKSNCYESANFGATLAQGEYLCFPSDDNYYVPGVLKIMLEPGTDLVYCDMLHDPRSRHGLREYRVVRVRPRKSAIDKGGFLIRRSKFLPFPWEHSLQSADGLLIDELIRRGVSHAKARGILWLHN